MDLPELQAAMESHGAAWSGLLAQDLDPDAVNVRRHDDKCKKRFIETGFHRQIHILI